MKYLELRFKCSSLLKVESPTYFILAFQGGKLSVYLLNTLERNSVPERIPPDALMCGRSGEDFWRKGFSERVLYGIYESCWCFF